MRENYILMYLKWYIIPLFLFVFVLTFFENFYLFLLIFVILFICYTILALKYKNINFVTIIFFLGGISLLSFFIFNVSYYKTNYYTKYFTKKVFIIYDTYKLGEYIVKDDFGGKFIAKNLEKDYKIGDKLKIYGMLIPVTGDFYLWREKFFSKKIDFLKITQIGKFDYGKFLKMKGINGIIYVKGNYFYENITGYNFFGNIKQFISDKIKYLYKKYPDKYKALILGLLIGDKSLLDKKTYKEFINSGLVHIIVVSGGNMMFFMIFLSFILFFVPFYFRLFLIGLFLIFYTLIVGLDSSVIRALIMGILALLALFYGQYVSTERLLGLAFIFMVIYNPYFLLYDLGFILSFLAIIGILYFNKFQYKIGNDYYIPTILGYKTTFKEFKKLKKGFLDNLKFIFILSGLKFWNNYFLPTIGATIFISPAILFFTKKFNLLSGLASLVVIPFVPIIMFLNIVALIMIMFNISGYNLIITLNKPLLDLIFFMSNLIGNNFTFFIYI